MRLAPRQAYQALAYADRRNSESVHRSLSEAHSPCQCAGCWLHRGYMNPRKGQRASASRR